MIAKAKAISHGINDIRYITGESQHKKHPEKIYRVLDNLLPSEPDAMGIWSSMQLTLSQHRPINRDAMGQIKSIIDSKFGNVYDRFKNIQNII